jgi:ribosomal protein L11 methyltransferase
VSYAFRRQGSLEDVEVALLWEAGCQGVWQDGNEVVAYFAKRVTLPVAGQWEAVADRDYLAAYEAELKPVALSRLVVVPSHCELPLGSNKLFIRLDPGMAFGSGHHETTRLALEALEALELSSKRVLDLGAGSGILAIAAKRLGAGLVVGLDLDPHTVPVAQANAKANGAEVDFRAGTLYGEADESYDVVVANLYAELHAELAGEYARVLAPGGTLLLTGILQDRRALVQSALEPYLGTLAWHRAGSWLLWHGAKGA